MWSQKLCDKGQVKSWLWIYRGQWNTTWVVSIGNQRDNILHTRTSLRKYTIWDRKEYYNTTVWCEWQFSQGHDRQTFSIQSPPPPHPPPQPNPRHSEIYVAIFVVDASVAGSSIKIEGSPTQGRIVLPKMLIKPPLRNTVLGHMQIWEQNWIAQNIRVGVESWHLRTSISTYSPCRALPYL